MFGPDPSPKNQAIFTLMAGEMADRYLAEVLIPSLGKVLDVATPSESAIRASLSTAEGSLRAFLGYYAFSRRGKDRYELSSIALEALDRFEPDTFNTFIGQPDALQLWDHFVDVCTTRQRKPMEKSNGGVVAGMAELAQEIFAVDSVGSIAGWVLSCIDRHGRLEPPFLRIVDVRGLGPKLASLLLRDIVFMFDYENRVEAADRLYCLPIDKWTRMIAPLIIEEPDVEHMPDWVLAGKVCKYARRNHISSIRFSMGLSYFGQRVISPNLPFADQVESALASRFSLH